MGTYARNKAYHTSSGAKLFNIFNLTSQMRANGHVKHFAAGRHGHKNRFFNVYPISVHFSTMTSKFKIVELCFLHIMTVFKVQNNKNKLVIMKKKSKISLKSRKINF